MPALDRRHRLDQPPEDALAPLVSVSLRIGAAGGVCWLSACEAAAATSGSSDAAACVNTSIARSVAALDQNGAEPQRGGRVAALVSELEHSLRLFQVLPVLS